MKVGDKFTYHNIKKVGPKCRKHAVIREVTYKGMEGNKAVFETEAGTELLIHKDDLHKYLMEVS